MDSSDELSRSDAEFTTSSRSLPVSRKRTISDDSSLEAFPAAKRQRAQAVAVVPPDVVFPASLHASSETRRGWMKEGDALRDLLAR